MCKTDKKSNADWWIFNKEEETKKVSDKKESDPDWWIFDKDKKRSEKTKSDKD